MWLVARFLGCARNDRRVTRDGENEGACGVGGEVVGEKADAGGEIPRLRCASLGMTVGVGRRRAAREPPLQGGGKGLGVMGIDACGMRTGSCLRRRKKRGEDSRLWFALLGIVDVR